MWQHVALLAKQNTVNIQSCDPSDFRTLRLHDSVCNSTTTVKPNTYRDIWGQNTYLLLSLADSFPIIFKPDITFSSSNLIIVAKLLDVKNIGMIEFWSQTVDRCRFSESHSTMG